MRARGADRGQVAAAVEEVEPQDDGREDVRVLVSVIPFFALRPGIDRERKLRLECRAGCTLRFACRGEAGIEFPQFRPATNRRLFERDPAGRRNAVREPRKVRVGDARNLRLALERGVEKQVQVAAGEVLRGARAQELLRDLEALGLGAQQQVARHLAVAIEAVVDALVFRGKQLGRLEHTDGFARGEPAVVGLAHVAREPQLESLETKARSVVDMACAATLGRKARIVDRLREPDKRVLLALTEKPEVEVERGNLDLAAAIGFAVTQMQVDLRQELRTRLVKDREALIDIRLHLVEAEVRFEGFRDERIGDAADFGSFI